jgi:hypothetical protein
VNRKEDHQTGTRRDVTLGRTAATIIDPFTAERDGFTMNVLLIGYARVSTDEQDLTAQQNAWERLGVRSSLIYIDHGLTGINRARPGLRETLAACLLEIPSLLPNPTSSHAH